jgi:hypothetical protein
MLTALSSFLWLSPALAEPTPALESWGERILIDESGGFVSSVDATGDFNGDGYPDLVAGVDMDIYDLYGATLLYIFPGGPDGIDPDAPQLLTSPDSPDDLGFGHVIEASGDLNGDGYSDLVVSAGTHSSLYGDIAVVYV